MMLEELKIGKNSYRLYFGINFIREMDKRYTMDSGPVKFGMGLQAALYYLSNRNPVVIFDIIRSATATLDSKPSNLELEEWLEHQDIEQLSEDFLSTLESSPMTRAQMKNLKDQVAKALEQQ